uniref:DUF4200 domain-containing protein n=1 Tax=Schistocephalus solidus TaxID=70667 RepID=A0A183TSA6_SCHSO
LLNRGVVEVPNSKEDLPTTGPEAAPTPPTEAPAETLGYAKGQNVPDAEPENISAEITKPAQDAAEPDSAAQVIEEEAVNTDLVKFQAEVKENPKKDTDKKKREMEHQALLKKHKALLERRRQEGELNTQFQTKLVDYFRRKRADAAEQAVDEIDGRSSLVDNTVDFNQR